MNFEIEKGVADRPVPPSSATSFVLLNSPPLSRESRQAATKWVVVGLLKLIMTSARLLIWLGPGH